ncbi:MAG TPA: MFS transporter [Povalibacter sp.]|jgi:ACS family hexuronate transporter-like MFS transporter|nr:MFS transporter [Povalibacter sp.]
MSSAPSTAATKIGNYRWLICALLFFATTINYIDRNALSVLKTTLQAHLNWTDVDYGWVTFAFTVAYAAFPSITGRVIDRWGVKKSLAAALILWSLMAAAHGLVGTVVGFALVRFFLGVAEAANFPASIKAVAMWFPQKERALATGLFNSGTNVGVMVSAGTVWLAGRFGWQAAFVAIGAIGFIWLLFWQKLFHAPEDHPRLSRAELDYIRGDQPPKQETLRLPWTQLLRYRQIWPFLIGKMITDPVWWFFLFWLPSYLERERGQDALKSSGWLAVIYTGATVGSIAGGWLSGHLIKRGWHVGKARLTTMGIAALCMPASIIAYYSESFAVAIVLIMLATAAHQAWSANIFTSATDLFPQKVSGSVVGLGATTGGIGGMFMTLLAALAVQWTGNQQVVFIIAGIMHPLSLLIFLVWLKGRFDQVDMSQPHDLSSAHSSLIAAGSIIGLLGVVFMVLIGINWELCVEAATLSGAATAMTAAAGVLLVGLALVYAGLPQKRLQT